MTPAALTLAPAMGSSLDFGPVPVGTMVEQAYVVTNTGQQSTTPIAVTFATSDTSFTIVPHDGDCVSGVTALLMQNDTCLIHVQFLPDMAVPSMASLAVSATTGGSPPSIALTGQGQ